jgi:hypothetical protein
MKLLTFRGFEHKKFENFKVNIENNFFPLKILVIGLKPSLKVWMTFPYGRVSMPVRLVSRRRYYVRRMEEMTYKGQIL